MLYNINLLKKNVVLVLGKNISECYDTKYLFSLYTEYNDNLYRYGSFNDGKTKLKIDILENYIIYLFQKKNRTLEENDILKKASSFYNEMGKGRKSFLLNSIIFNNIRYLGRSFFKDYDVIMSRLGSVSKELRQYYDMYMNNSLKSDVEITRLMEFLTGKIGNDKFKNSLENVFRKLLNSEQDISISEKNFLVQYINYNKCNKLGLPLAKVYITKKDLFDGHDISNDYKGVSHGNTGIIGLNEYEFEKDFNIISKNFNISRGLLCLTTVNHELEHYKQSSMVNSGILNQSSFAMIKNSIFRNYLSTKDFDEFVSNYRYRETEMEANVNGWKDTAKLMESYAKDTKGKEIEQCYYLSGKKYMEKANSWQLKKLGDKKKKTTIENYNIKNLIEIVKNNPNLLNNFPQLNEFFDKSGNIHKPFAFFEKYTDLELKKLKTSDNNLKEEINGKQSCYEEFIDYLFINKSFDDLDFSNYGNYEAMLTFFSLLGQMFYKECEQIKNMCSTFDKDNIVDFVVILDKRKSRLDKYFEYINNNQELIGRLNLYNQEHLSERHRLFNWYLDLEKLHDEMRSVDRHIERLKNSNDIFKDESYGRRF